MMNQTTLERAFEYAYNKYNYKNFEMYNETPCVLELNNKRYILITKSHPGVCDENECQETYNNSPGLELMHTFVHIYTYKCEHELCIYHIFEKHKAIISKNQILTSEECNIINEL